MRLIVRFFFFTVPKTIKNFSFNTKTVEINDIYLKKLLLNQRL